MNFSIEEEITLDNRLEVLKNNYRREILYLFHESDDVFGYDEIVDQLNEKMEAQRDELETCLQHAHLPKLEDYGVVSYDEELDLIAYQRDEELEELLEVTRSLEA
jgi:hypothetical protein